MKPRIAPSSLGGSAGWRASRKSRTAARAAKRRRLPAESGWPSSPTCQICAGSAQPVARSRVSMARVWSRSRGAEQVSTPRPPPPPPPETARSFAVSEKSGGTCGHVRLKPLRALSSRSAGVALLEAQARAAAARGEPARLGEPRVAWAAVSTLPPPKQSLRARANSSVSPRAGCSSHAASERKVALKLARSRLRSSS